MAKENAEGAESADKSVDEVTAILEFLPDVQVAQKPAEPAKVEVEEKSETEEEAGNEGNEEDPEGEKPEGEEEDPEKEKPEVGSEKVQKRIDKLTARAKTAEERAEAAEARANELEAEAAKLREEGGKPMVVSAPSAQNPLADVSNISELESRVENAVAVKRWCIENPDGGTVQDKDGNDVEIEPAQARKMLADAEEVITLHAPRRHRFLVESEGHRARAREIYPEMFQKGSEMENAFQSLVKAWPEVTRYPDFHLVIGHYLTGMKLSEGKKPAAPVEKKKPAIAPPVPKASAPKPTVGVNKVPKFSQVIESGGTEDALAEYFAG